MKTIPAKTVEAPEGAALVPSAPIPATAILVVCDGANYLVYEEGDALPQEVPKAD